MALTPIGGAGGSVTSPFSSAYRASFCINDDGAGGSIQVNAKGQGGSQLLDLSTLLGAAWCGFHSNLLWQLFQRPFPSAAAAINALLKNLTVFQFFATALPTFTFQPNSVTVSGQVFPMLLIQGPASAGTVRFDLRLNHTLDV